jgi:hypothetical protein
MYILGARLVVCKRELVKSRLLMAERCGWVSYEKWNFMFVSYVLNFLDLKLW